MSYRRRRVAHGAALQFLPSSISKVVGWLRASSAATVITGSGISSLADVLGGSAAVQTTDGERPARGVGSIITWLNDDLEWPLQEGVNNQLTATGLAWWMRTSLSAAAGRQVYFAKTTPATANRLGINVSSGEAVLVDVFHSDAVIRRAQTAINQVGDNVWEFWTVEIDLSLATEATQVLITKNGTPLALTFSNALGAPGAMPASFVQPTGPALLGAGTSAAASPFTGDWGPNVFALSGQLTTTERTNLMNFEIPA